MYCSREYRFTVSSMLSYAFFAVMRKILRFILSAPFVRDVTIKPGNVCIIREDANNIGENAYITRAQKCKRPAFVLPFNSIP